MASPLDAPDSQSLGPSESDGDERVSTSFARSEDDPPLILRGGKVNPEAIALAYRRAAESGEASEDGDDPLWHITFTLQRDLKTRLDKYLTSRITFMSRSQLQRLIGEGGVTVNDGPSRAATKLRAGDRVTVVVPPPPSGEITPQDIPIEVLYEDEQIIVLNKAAGIIVHPARTEKSGTLINALAWHFRHRSETGGELSPVGSDDARPGVVHRLDRDTTGCIVFAKTEEAHWKLGRQFEFRTTDKRYLALSQGRTLEDTMVVDKPIGPHPSKEKGFREKQVIRADSLGKPSLTIARTRERYTLPSPDGTEQDFSLLELELKTGRTHQIRVHLTSEDYPIVGDDMYGGRHYTMPAPTREDPDATHTIGRQMLHAALLAIEHPITGEPMVFTAPPPPDFVSLVRHFRAYETETVHVQGTVPFARIGLSA